MVVVLVFAQEPAAGLAAVGVAADLLRLDLLQFQAGAAQRMLVVHALDRDKPPGLTVDVGRRENLKALGRQAWRVSGDELSRFGQVRRWAAEPAQPDQIVAVPLAVVGMP